MIQCSEKCIHESDGLCSLQAVTHPSKTPKKDCPYYNGKEDKYREAPTPRH